MSKTAIVEDAVETPAKGGIKLVIVESPTKARTIGRMLGPGYRIVASMGHVRDLPDGKLGVDVEHDFKPEYVESKKRNVGALREAAKGVTAIYLATDPDREGEAIAWHLKEMLEKKDKKVPFSRLEFHEITRNAIDKAFATPREIDYQLVDAQQARRVLDRLVGYQVSPLLWSQIERGISAGRVQSVALRLVCEREREIQGFVPQEYWVFAAELAKGSDRSETFIARLVKIDGAKADVNNADSAAAIYEAVRQVKSFKVSDVKVEPVFRRAPAPFITSTLQQAASSRLRYNASHAMQIAQQLYEGVDIGESGPTGLITYMRTDSFTIAKEAQEACRAFIAAEYGPEYVPAKPNFYKNKSLAQEAHEAIRPTDVNRRPEDMERFLDKDQMRLYTLIWKRFTASQMSPAKLSRTTVETTAAGQDRRNYLFRTTGSVVEFPGFLRVAGDTISDTGEDDSENAPPAFLAKLKPGETCDLVGLKHEQKFTEPPPRFSEASLIKELESNGIGRPSTYATIVSTIQKRDYVKRDKGKLIPEDLGFRVNDYLVSTLPSLFEVGFTAEMETKLDRVESGEESWTGMLRNFYDKFAVWLDSAKYDSAPDNDKVLKLLDLFDTVKEWDAPVKKGKRTYDDAKFVASVRKQFTKNQKLSGKQWLSLLKLAWNYRARIAGLEATAAELGFKDDLAAASGAVAEDQERREQRGADDAEGAKQGAAIIAFLVNVEIPAPPPGSKGFDERDFLESLRQRAAAGKPFTDRQLKALSRLAIGHKDQIPRFDELTPLLGVTADDVAKGAATEPGSELDLEIKGLLEHLGKVEKWNEPSQKGRRSYDDGSFYKSLHDQYERKHVLSVKQIAALKKLKAKYDK